MKTEIILIVDKSGSMATLANDTIGGYNTFLADQVKNEIDANISTLLFDTNHTWFERDVDVAHARQLDRQSYFPTGSTALNDAIARAYHVLEHKDPKQAVVVIITDGEENASKETQSGAVKGMIEAMQKKDYRIVYLAANQDAFKTGQNIGIQTRNIANFAPTSLGTRSAYSVASNAAVSYASAGLKGINDSAQAVMDSLSH